MAGLPKIDPEWERGREDMPSGQASAEDDPNAEGPAGNEDDADEPKEEPAPQPKKDEPKRQLGLSTG